MLERIRHTSSLRLLLPAGATAGAAAGLLLYAVLAPIDTSPILDPVPNPIEATASAPSSANIGVPDLSDPTLASRPLFNPERRPAAPELQPETAKNLPERDPRALVPDGLRLVGTASHVQGARMALIAWVKHPQGEWLQLGDKIGPWKLVEIGADQVSLQAAAQRKELTMDAPSSTDGAVNAARNSP